MLCFLLKELHFSVLKITAFWDQALGRSCEISVYLLLSLRCNQCLWHYGAELYTQTQTDPKFQKFNGTVSLISSNVFT